MAEYIERDATLEALSEEQKILREREHWGQVVGLEAAKIIIQKLPSADVVTVKRGEWIKYTISDLFTYTCSGCNCDVDIKRKTPYCPECGVDMRGNKNEQK